MKAVVKAALVSLVIATVAYISAAVYTNVNANYGDSSDYSHRYVVYAAYKYEQDALPIKWYTAEELGIIEIREVDSRTVQIVVDREKEPFPFGPYGTDNQLTVFLYKDEFYSVTQRWVDFADGRVIQLQTLTGIALGASCVITGALFYRERKKR